MGGDFKEAPPGCSPVRSWPWGGRDGLVGEVCVYVCVMETIGEVKALNNNCSFAWDQLIPTYMFIYVFMKLPTCKDEQCHALILIADCYICIYSSVFTLFFLSSTLTQRV